MDFDPYCLIAQELSSSIATIGSAIHNSLDPTVASVYFPVSINKFNQELYASVRLFETPLKKLVLRLSRNRFVHSVITDRADLSAFRRRPDLRIISGVSAIAFSYVISWPLIALLGIAAVHYGNAAIVVVGGPVAYGLSHLVFMLGMYLAGAKYSRIFLRWAVCRGMTRLMARYRLPLPTPSLPDVAVVAPHDEQGGHPGADPAPPTPCLGSRCSGGENGHHGKG